MSNMSMVFSKIFCEALYVIATAILKGIRKLNVTNLFLGTRTINVTNVTTPEKTLMVELINLDWNGVRQRALIDVGLKHYTQHAQHLVLGVDP